MKDQITNLLNLAKENPVKAVVISAVAVGVVAGVTLLLTHKTDVSVLSLEEINNRLADLAADAV